MKIASDKVVTPGWAYLCTNLLRGGGIVVGAVLIWLGLRTGGLFLALTGGLGAIAIIGGWLLGGLIERQSWYEGQNAQAKSYALAIGFPMALLVVALVAGPLLTQDPVLGACFSGQPARGGELHSNLAMDPRVSSMQFTLQIDDVSGGALRWSILDPKGQSAWSGREEVAGTFKTGEISAIAGNWSVNVISEADHAVYALEWTGSAVGFPDMTQSPPPCQGANL